MKSGNTQRNGRRGHLSEGRSSSIPLWVYIRIYAAESAEIKSSDRFATPEEVGEFITVLLSNKQGGTGFMAGSDVVLDGGER